MEIYAPHYYGKFRCIADKCRHSCCVGWEIGIDAKTYDIYKGIEEILSTVTVCEDGPCFALCEDGRCPHLSEDGLCKIILSHGESYLSEICRNHPRFFHPVGKGRMEAGLGIVCEEACRLLLTNEEPFSLSKTEELDGEGAPDAVLAFDPLPERDRILSMIEAPGDDFDEKRALLQRVFALPAPYTAHEWRDRFLSLEILDADWERDLCAIKDFSFFQSGDENYGKYYKRLLLYFVYRHVSVAKSEEDLRARLAFALLSVDVIRALFAERTERSLAELIDCARRYSAEIEYSEDNRDELIFSFLCGMHGAE